MDSMIQSVTMRYGAITGWTATQMHSKRMDLAVRPDRAMVIHTWVQRLHLASAEPAHQGQVLPKLLVVKMVPGY